MDVMEEKKAAATLKIDFDSRTENLSLVEKLVDDVCAEHKISEDYYGNILIAVTEAVNNAIQHGNKMDDAKKVSVCFSTNKTDFRFTVQDQGDGFNYDDLPDPTNPENIEKPNGRGIFLMRNLADEVNFFQEGRQVELKFASATS